VSKKYKRPPRRVQRVKLRRRAVIRLGGEFGLAVGAARSHLVLVERRDDLCGRPSSEALVKDEWRRRRAEGILEPTVKDQATKLAAWLHATHPNAPSMRASTIENKIPRWR
jgi:hypothetical protein